MKSFFILLACLFVLNVANAQTIEDAFEEEYNQLKNPKDDTDAKTHRKEMDTLIAAIEGKDLSAYNEAVRVIPLITRPSDAALLVRKLRDYVGYPERQIPVIRAIGQTKDSSTIPQLLMEFEHAKVGSVQIAVIEALSVINDDSVVAFLGKVLTSPGHTEIAIKAATALGKMTGSKALYVLEQSIQLLKDSPEKNAAVFARLYVAGEMKETHTSVSSDFKQGVQQLMWYKGSPFYLFAPRQNNPEYASWLMVCVHSETLDADTVFNACVNVAKDYKLAVITPIFDDIHFPNYGGFNIDGVRADTRLKEIIAFASQNVKLKTRELFFFGYGVGGDFIQRFVFSNPQMVARAAFQPNNILSMDNKLPFPMGVEPVTGAKDLSFNVAEIIKMDAALIFVNNKVVLGNLRKAIEPISIYGEKEQVATRLRFMRIDAPSATLENVFPKAKEYLFQKL